MDIDFFFWILFKFCKVCLLIWELFLCVWRGIVRNNGYRDSCGIICFLFERGLCKKILYLDNGKYVGFCVWLGVWLYVCKCVCFCVCEYVCVWGVVRRCMCFLWGFKYWNYVNMCEKIRNIFILKGIIFSLSEIKNKGVKKKKIGFGKK